jgi:hypothetical protein
MTRKRTIPPRIPIFFGCEGESERGYGALLNRLIRDSTDLHLHIHTELLQPGAGDPLALLQRAIQKIDDLQRKRTAFAYKAVLLDKGRHDKNQEARRIAAKGGIILIWQRPDHEGFLLRHLDGCQQHRPPAGASFKALRQHWPDYAKPQTQMQLAQRITLPHLKQVCSVEPDLRVFLTAIKVI